MTMKEIINALIDQHAPILPSEKRKSADFNAVLKSINDSAQDGLTAIESQLTDMQALVDDKADGAVISTWMGNIEAQLLGMQSALSGKADASHVHTIAQVTGLQAALNGKQASITPSAAIANAATNAATDANTSMNTIGMLLPNLTNEVNASNAKQNDLAAKYNDLATKFNTLKAQLVAQGLKAA